MTSPIMTKNIEMYNVRATCQSLYNVRVMQQTRGHATYKGYQPMLVRG